MTVRLPQPEKQGVYFITFTNYNWLPLFEITNGYSLVYKWFDFLKQSGSYLLGYVIMPNHLHVLIAFRNNHQSINTRVGGGKRFLAYDIVARLKEQNNIDLLKKLEAGVNQTDKHRGKIHQVFEPSFDCKQCLDVSFMQQKLDYMHGNPCRGKWNLASDIADYPHSSAKFYLTGSQGIYPVTTVGEILDLDLSFPQSPHPTEG